MLFRNIYQFILLFNSIFQKCEGGFMLYQSSLSILFQLSNPPSLIPFPWSNIIIMQKQALLSQLHLRSLQLVQSSPSARKNQPPSQRVPNSTRTLMKLYLTREILQECLQSLDIFRELLDDPVQRTKLLRDVGKNIQLKLYDEGAVVYNRGQIAESLYMVIKGQVSLCLPGQEGVEGQEIDVFGEGVGFGQAEFVHGRRRALVAKACGVETVVGVIEAQAFEEIIELYRQRVYLRKSDLFGRCPLLHRLATYQLEFIVHNAKPATFPIGKDLVSEGETARTVFLITEGSVELRTAAPSSPSPQLFKYRTNSKAKLQDVVNDKIKLKRLVVGTLQEGQFLGDCELALGIPYAFTAVVTSSRLRAYACDERIILSQMTPELFAAAAHHYQRKQSYRADKPQVYEKAKSQLQRRLELQQPCRLSPEQERAKRIIISRYVEPVPSLVGRMSPREIARVVDRKCARAHTQPTSNPHCLPSLNVLPPAKRLVADPHAYSPLLRREREQHRQRRPTELISATPQRYQYQTMEIGEGFQRSESKPPLLFMKPFVKKVLSLHERLCKEYGAAQKGMKRLGNYSVIQMRKVRLQSRQLKADL